MTFATSKLLATALAVAGLSTGPASLAQSAPPASDDPVASAESAAPTAVSKAATIVLMGADGSMRTLRQDTNGFSCMPDNPATPGPDPMCMDANAMDWAMAWIGKLPPPTDRPGFMYMLAGGTDASNTDPYATEPTEGADWISTGPHVMIVGSTAALEGYPTSATPDTSVPYVMWADTPYAHLMIPVD